MTEGGFAGRGAQRDEPDGSAVDAFNRSVIDEFRANGGRVGGMFEGSSLVLLTTIGARSGLRRTVPLACFDVNGVPIVVASAMGSRSHPAWYVNITANPRARVERGRGTFDALASVPTGIERDRLFAQVTERDPEFAAYQERTSRVIPVVVLEPIVPGPGPATGEHMRLVTWSAELRQVHRRLRYALQAAQEAAAGPNPSDGAVSELLLFCHGFCLALSGHHEGEDRELFPAIAAAHPELRDTLRYLQLTTR